MQWRNYINEMVIYRHMDTDADLLDNEWNWDWGANNMTTRCTSIYFLEANFRMRFH